MLNTFLIKHEVTGKIEGLDDLVLIQNSHFNVYFRVRETDFLAQTLPELHDAVRVVSPGFRTLLQKLDDDLEVLNTRREDILANAFKDGLQLSVEELKDYLE